ncbi:hypothetical protein SB778_03515 [Paraburkholderia sp. SIMBA_050]
MKVAFFKGRHPGIKGWLGVLTKWWTRGPYSHAELVMAYESGMAVCWSSAYLDKGVRRTVIKLDPADWDIVEIPTTSEQEATAIAWFEAHVGQPYDIAGLFGFVFRHLEGEKGKWFCSEALAEALGYAESWRYDPNTFAAVLGHWERQSELQSLA